MASIPAEDQLTATQKELLRLHSISPDSGENPTDLGRQFKASMLENGAGTLTGAGIDTRIAAQFQAALGLLTDYGSGQPSKERARAWINGVLAHAPDWNAAVLRGIAELAQKPHRELKPNVDAVVMELAAEHLLSGRPDGDTIAAELAKRPQRCRIAMFVEADDGQLQPVLGVRRGRYSGISAEPTDSTGSMQPADRAVAHVVSAPDMSAADRVLRDVELGFHGAGAVGVGPRDEHFVILGTADAVSASELVRRLQVGGFGGDFPKPVVVRVHDARLAHSAIEADTPAFDDTVLQPAMPAKANAVAELAAGLRTKVKKVNDVADAPNLELRETADFLARDFHGDIYRGDTEADIRANMQRADAAGLYYAADVSQVAESIRQHRGTPHRDTYVRGLEYLLDYLRSDHGSRIHAMAPESAAALLRGYCTGVPMDMSQELLSLVTPSDGQPLARFWGDRGNRRRSPLEVAAIVDVGLDLVRADAARLAETSEAPAVRDRATATLREIEEVRAVRDAAGREVFPDVIHYDPVRGTFAAGYCGAADPWDGQAVFTLDPYPADKARKAAVQGDRWQRLTTVGTGADDLLRGVVQERARRKNPTTVMVGAMGARKRQVLSLLESIRDCEGVSYRPTKSRYWLNVARVAKNSEQFGARAVLPVLAEPPAPKHGGNRFRHEPTRKAEITSARPA